MHFTSKAILQQDLDLIHIDFDPQPTEGVFNHVNSPGVQCLCGLFGMDVDTEGQATLLTAKGGEGKSTLTPVNIFHGIYITGQFNIDLKSPPVLVTRHCSG